MIEISRNPSSRELLFFFLGLGLFTVLVGALAYLQWDAPAAASRIWIAGGSLTVLHFAIPPLRRFIFLTWMYAAFPIGWTVSHLLLGAIFYLLITPIGLLVRATGHDPMKRKFDPDATSYWNEHRTGGDSSSYFRQY